MTTRILLLLLVAPSATWAQTTFEAQSSEELLRQAAEAYRAGLDNRADSMHAQSHFAQAAEAYDRLRRRGYDDADLAAQRARAYLLAGKLGHAIAAYRQGLQRAPHDRRLRKELQYARERVIYPKNGPVMEQAKPAETSPLLLEASLDTLGPWMVVIYCLSCAALARGWMKRQPGWAKIGGILLGSALLIGAIIAYAAIQVAEEERVPGVVVDEPTPLYAGNGEHYPHRLDRLPTGVEARILLRRGAWIQIELTGGMVGWIPGATAVSVSNDR